MKNLHTQVIDKIEKLDWEKLLGALGGERGESRGTKPNEASTPKESVVTLTHQHIPELHPSETVKAELRHDPEAKTVTCKIIDKPETLSPEQIGAAVKKTIETAKK